MKRVSRGIAIVLIITTSIALTSVARAAHATNFLNALYGEVTNRVASGTNSADEKTLQRAAKILNRNTRTLSADVTALGSAGKVLDTRFENDATLFTLEETALAAYATEAHTEVNGASVRLLEAGFSNSIPARVGKQFLLASNAVAEFDANTNDFPARARSLAQAFAKLRSPVAKIFQTHPNPPAMSPGAFLPPSNFQLEVALAPGQSPSTQNIYYFHSTDEPLVPHPTPHFTYFANNPAENSEANPGTWTYTKTGQATATLHCTANSPAGLVHDFLLTFTTTTVGTFTGTNANGQSISGSFYID